MSLKKNVIANYFGQGWAALMGLAFIPLYIKYLGIEAYGLIGIFAMLQAWLTLLDMGMTPTLGREMARFTGGGHDAQSIRNLLRSIVTIGLCIALIVFLGVWTGSTWIATNWVNAGKLPVPVVAQAFTVMGLVTALRFIEGIYRSAVVGLQRQVILNAATIILETLRGLGAVGILVFISPTIGAFFIWQGLLSLATLAIFAWIVYSSLPKSPRPASFSVDSLQSVWRFASGMLLITVLALLLTQVDKILLSRLLTLEAFGYYSLAFVVSNAIYRLAGPVTQAIFPHFAALEARGDQTGLILAYHKGAQLVTVLMGPAAIVLMVYPDVILGLWTRNMGLTEKVAPLLAVLSAGVLLNGLMQIPSLLQLAHNWTSLTVKVNAIAVCVIVPAIIGSVSKYGAIGAAWTWVALNTGYVLIQIPLIHRRILRTEKWRWYFQDVAVPLVAASIAALLLRQSWPAGMGNWGQVTALMLSSGLTMMASVLAAPLVREQLGRHLPATLKSSFKRRLV